MKHRYGEIAAVTVFAACVLNASTFVNDKPSRFLKYVTVVSLARIDTDVPIQRGQSLEMKVCTANRTGLKWTQFFGNDSGLLTVGNLGGVTQLKVNGTTVEKTLTWAKPDDVLLELETSSAGTSLKANGEVICSTEATVPETSATWRFFAFSDQQDTYSSYRFYYARIRNADGAVIADFQPCICRGQVAVYDAVAKRCYFPDQYRNQTARLLAGAGVSSAQAKELDYIQLNYTAASADAELNTGVRARSGTKVEVTFSLASTSGDFGIVGARNPNAVRFMLAHVYQNKIRCGYGSVSAAGDLTMEPNKTYTLVADYHKGSQTIDVDGVRVYTGTSGEEVDTQCNLALFATAYPPTPGGCLAPTGTRIGRVRIWQGNVDGSDYKLVRDYTPVWQDGFVGFYDTEGSGIDVSTSYYSWPDVFPEGSEPEAWLQYVESGFGAVVDTGVLAEDGIKAELDIAVAYGSDFKYRVFPVLTAQTSAKFELFTVDNNKSRIGYNGATTVGSTFRLGERQTVVSEAYAGQQKLTVGGVTYASASGSGYSGSDTIQVFGRAEDASAPVRLYGLKIWKGAADGSNPQLIRNFKPALCGGRVALYDTVGSKAYFDKVTVRGGLVAGPKVGAKPKFYEYLEAPGNQFVDTGVVGKTPIEAQAEVEWTALGDLAVLLGSRAGNDRVIPLSANGGKWQLAHGESWWDVGTAQIGKNYLAEATQADGRQVLVVDGVTNASQKVSGDVDTGLPLYVFARNYSGASDFGKAKCRSLKIQSDGTPLRDFRACRLDGHSGFWDAVTESFFPAGAFPFTQRQEFATGPKVPIGLLLLVR